ncbi:tRNA1(Val) A37 N6-methylase TrmN6 [Natronospira proteinivora]|uniref:tRNA1(Val) A37 N6-methylase TrmN6 n=1 Tax=Natronospira proteinivora TaxID=1807133 RepID=A0ABT1GBP1_9GAMM|nr:class I SAM-dependent methyltransferase [Natronospira proteinivora]MCP1727703.1 tRNA1(Val) A37 N6-methylase TrmN6 [Natronospira proteinivora]
MKPPLTQLAHDHLEPLLRPGDYAVDATVGNGHDTLFLAGQVGESGHVLGLDIQEAAIRVAGGRLRQAGLDNRVSLIQTGHERLTDILPTEMQGRLKVVMFNLGYLPGGDQQLITRADTTLEALSAALSQLAEDGLISLMVYRGHPGGQEEYQAILDWLKAEECRWSLPPVGERPDHAPILMHIHP